MLCCWAKLTHFFSYFVFYCNIVKHTLTMTHTIRQTLTHDDTLTHTHNYTQRNTYTKIHLHALTYTMTNTITYTYTRTYVMNCTSIIRFAKDSYFVTKKNIIWGKRVNKPSVLLGINSPTFQMYISYINWEPLC